MDADVRVLPFTDEEKARLNEKVRGMISLFLDCSYCF